jgi:tRNA threonylcarbamoyladenosine biosynthesis protein TsaB
VELSIDSVGLQSSVAVSDAGRPLVEISWPTGRRHTPSLIPTVDEAMRRAGAERSQLTAVFVDVGPGAYGGIRAGMAAATAIALALGLPAVGVGRLEIEAYAHAAAGVVTAVHAAGRRQWAVARYRGPASQWREEAEPRLVAAGDLAAALGEGPVGVCCGDLEALPDATRAALQDDGWTLSGGAANMRRAALLAELGWRRLEAARARGDDLHPARLQPIYLREPAIGPQPPPPAKEPQPMKETSR